MIPEPATEEAGEIISLQQQVARLQALLEISRQVHATVEAEEVLRKVLEIVVRELEMAGALFTEPRMSYGECPEEPWHGCPRFQLNDKDGKLLTELVVFPRAGETMGFYEQDFLEGLALQASVALENAHYHKRNLEWARVQYDLDAARLIQRSLLPQAMPDIRGYCVAARSSACYEVGGDYLDIFQTPSGEQFLVVADVAGKGLASAIISTAFRSAFRAMALSGMELAELTARLGQQHWTEGPEARRRYVTAMFVKLDPVSHTAQAVNAGHTSGFLVHADGTRYLINASGPPLGLLPGMTYSAETVVLHPGSRLLFYTDGMTEVFRDDEEFGEERLLELFATPEVHTSADMLDLIWKSLDEFSSGGHQHDDMTALALHRNPASQEEPVCQ